MSYIHWLLFIKKKECNILCSIMTNRVRLNYIINTSRCSINNMTTESAALIRDIK